MSENEEYYRKLDELEGMKSGMKLDEYTPNIDASRVSQLLARVWKPLQAHLNGIWESADSVATSKLGSNFMALPQHMNELRRLYDDSNYDQFEWKYDSRPDVMDALRDLENKAAVIPRDRVDSSHIRKMLVQISNITQGLEWLRDSLKDGNWQYIPRTASAFAQYLLFDENMGKAEAALERMFKKIVKDVDKVEWTSSDDYTFRVVVNTNFWEETDGPDFYLVGDNVSANLGMDLIPLYDKRQLPDGRWEYNWEVDIESFEDD